MILLLGNCNHQFISGIVFFDENKNGIIDSDEKGIAGVMVYTKSSSTKTNKDGKYSLKVSPGESYVMILPDPEHSPPLDQYGQPVFYKKIKEAPIVFPLEKKRTK